jgi:hypothetical protein
MQARGRRVAVMKVDLIKFEIKIAEHKIMIKEREKKFSLFFSWFIRDLFLFFS